MVIPTHGPGGFDEFVVSAELEDIPHVLLFTCVMQVAGAHEVANALHRLRDERQRPHGAHVLDNTVAS